MLKTSAHRAAHRAAGGADGSTLRDRALVPVLVYTGLLVSMISSVGAPLVPTIATDFHIALGTAQWMLTITLLVGAVCVPVVGRLADGPRRLHVLIAVLALMAAGSVLAALPTGLFGLFLLGRGMQGVGMALVPLLMGIARDHLPPDRARSALATLSVTTVVGVGLGYPLTGAIAENLNYRYAFWLVGLLSVIALILAAVVVPTSKHHPAQRFDFVGSALLGAGLGALLLGVSMGDDWGWGSVRILALIVAALVVLAVWTWHQLRARHPLIDLRLMKDPTVATANMAGVLAGVGMYILMSMVIRFVQTPASTGYGLGESVLIGSLVLLPLSATSYVSSKLAAVLARRLDAARVLVLGMAAFIAALLVFSVARGQLWEIFVVMGIAGLGIGCSFAVMPRMIVGAVPAQMTSSALATNQVLRQVGFSVGSALSAAVLTAYTIAPSPFPTSHGYTVCAWAAMGMCLVTAVVVTAMQRRRRATPGPVAGPVAGPAADERLVAEESSDAAIAGIVAYEPDEDAAGGLG